MEVKNTDTEWLLLHLLEGKPETIWVMIPVTMVYMALPK
jgi:hypothetical protein